MMAHPAPAYALQFEGEPLEIDAWLSKLVGSCFVVKSRVSDQFLLVQGSIVAQGSGWNAYHGFRGVL